MSLPHLRWNPSNGIRMDEATNSSKKPLKAEVFFFETWSFWNFVGKLAFFLVSLIFFIYHIITTFRNSTVHRFKKCWVPLNTFNRYIFLPVPDKSDGIIFILTHTSTPFEQRARSNYSCQGETPHVPTLEAEHSEGGTHWNPNKTPRFLYIYILCNMCVIEIAFFSKVIAYLPQTFPNVSPCHASKKFPTKKMSRQEAAYRFLVDRVTV